MHFLNLNSIKIIFNLKKLIYKLIFKKEMKICGIFLITSVIIGISVIIETKYLLVEVDGATGKGYFESYNYSLSFLFFMASFN